MKNIRRFALALVASIGLFPVLYGGDMYVSAGNASALSPYDSWDTAAANIADAVAVADDGTTIHVAPGLYPISSQIEVTNGIRIVGAGITPSDTVVSNTVDSSNSKQQQRVFKINHADAFVANLTMQNGSTYAWGADGAKCRPTGTRANFKNGALDSSIEGTNFPSNTVVGTETDFFKDYANGDYRPNIQVKDGAPTLVNAGVNYEGMASIDLLGSRARLEGA